MNSTKKKIMAFSLVTAICGSAMSLSFASPAPDGKTDANVLANTTNTNAEWTAFQKKWGSLKSDWTQISLAPGSTPSSLNFAWYTKTGFKPSLKIGEGENMAHAKTYNARQSEVKDEKDLMWRKGLCKEAIENSLLIINRPFVTLHNYPSCLNRSRISLSFHSSFSSVPMSIMS